jgi:hypothetical protein
VCKEFPTKIPAKLECVEAFARFDQSCGYRLSHSMKTNGAPKRGQHALWSKDQGSALYKLLLWVWKARGRSHRSYDGDIADLKAALPGLGVTYAPMDRGKSGGPADMLNDIFADAVQCLRKCSCWVFLPTSGPPGC